MPIEIKMPALSPTMEEGTLAKWLVKEGDTVKAGDIMAEIETDKATMEFEAVDKGTIGTIVVAEGTDGVKVGAVIATLNADGEEGDSTPEPAAKESEARPSPEDPNKTGTEAQEPTRRRGRGCRGSRQARRCRGREAGRPPAPAPAPTPAPRQDGERVKASPLARRIAADKGVDLAGVAPAPMAASSRPTWRARRPVPPPRPPVPMRYLPRGSPRPGRRARDDPRYPAQLTKLSNMRKTIARRLRPIEAAGAAHLSHRRRAPRQAAGAADRAQRRAGGARGQLSVNDLMIKALAVALVQVPKCNVMFTPDQLVSFGRADISVAVSTPRGAHHARHHGGGTRRRCRASRRG
ncbi:biotin/lipoyl-containing protein [Sphingomonas sp. MMS24-JH45]